MATGPDTRWLERRGRAWSVFLAVPRPVQGVLGQKLRKALGTRDLAKAQRDRFAVLADFRKRIEEAERDLRRASKRPSETRFEEEAERWREGIQAAERGEDAVTGVHEDEDQAAFIQDRLTDRAEAVEARHGAAAAAPFGAVMRRETPLLHYVQAWLREGGEQGYYIPRTKVMHERNLNALKTWLVAARLPPSIGAVTRQVAGRYVSEALVPGRVPKTIASIVSSLRSYWTFLSRKGAGRDDDKNPWDNQAPRKAATKGSKDDEPRPFTDDEVCRLLVGPANVELADLMRVAALSGMRIDEAYRLTMRDCREGLFHIRKAKSRAGQRKTPIHSALTEIIARRSKGKAPTAFLFPEGGELVEGRERSAAVSKRFGRYRQRPGVDVHEKADDVRNSRVTFHSFRRWFITAAVRAGQPPHVVEQVVGHKAEGMTLGVYHGGDLESTLRVCVEAVQLPAGCTA